VRPREDIVNVKIADIMRSPVMHATPHQTASHVRAVMTEHHVSAMPVVGPDDEPLGMVTASDLLVEHPDGTPVSTFMAAPVITVPPYEQPHVAARIMRNHRTHHVIVAEHDRVVGIVSAFDLLALVEEHRFTMKQPPTPSRRSSGRA
jgi:CBS domain-containing protein